MLVTDATLLRAVLDRDSDTLRAAVPAGMVRILTIGRTVYTIRREVYRGRDILVVHEGARLAFRESVPAK